MGEEAATPGQPVRARPRFLDSPRKFTLENHRLPLALPQSFGKFRNSHVSLYHSHANRRAPQHKKSVSL